MSIYFNFITILHTQLPLIMNIGSNKSSDDVEGKKTLKEIFLRPVPVPLWKVMEYTNVLDLLNLAQSCHIVHKNILEQYVPFKLNKEIFNFNIFPKNLSNTQSRKILRVFSSITDLHVQASKAFDNNPRQAFFIKSSRVVEIDISTYNHVKRSLARR